VAKFNISLFSFVTLFSFSKPSLRDIWIGLLLKNLERIMKHVQTSEDAKSSVPMSCNCYHFEAQFSLCFSSFQLACYCATK
jgi:hypothetical protein